MLVDTLVLLVAVYVTAAIMQDRGAARALLDAWVRLSRVSSIWRPWKIERRAWAMQAQSAPTVAGRTGHPGSDVRCQASSWTYGRVGSSVGAWSATAWALAWRWTGVTTSGLG
jgi:hypothetical protein